MTSLPTFLLFWLAATLGILGYAVWDVPNVAHETAGFSVNLDWSRVGEIRHWGGRLINSDATALLLLNAACTGGMIALGIVWIMERLTKDVD